MSKYSYKRPALLLVCLMFFSVLPLYSVDAGDSQTKGRQGSTNPTAFISDWSISGTGALMLDYYPGIYSDGPVPYAYDDVGNLYIVMTEDEGSFGGYAYPGHGIHIMKLDPSGQLLWGKSISASSSCTSVASPSCMVIGLEIIGEDEFYIMISGYNMGSVVYSGTISADSATGYSLFTAFHDANNGWMWVDSIPLKVKGTDSVIHHRLDANDNLIISSRRATDELNYDTNYTITSYSTTGMNWMKGLEFESFDNAGMYYMDVEGNNLHYLIYTIGGLEFDSQTIACPANSQATVCLIWLTLDTNGVQTSAIAKPFPGVWIGSFAVRQGDAYVSGITMSIGGSESTSHNFTGTSVELGAESRILSVLNSNGSWGFVEHWPYAVDDTAFVLSKYTYYHTNGSSTHVIYQKDSGTSIDGNVIRDYSTYTHEYSLVTFDSQGTYQWHTSIGTSTSPDFRPYFSNEHGYATVYFESYGSHIFGDQYGNQYQSNENTNARHATLIWYSLENGSLLDFESVNGSLFPFASSPDGSLLTGYGSKIQYYAVDIDGDDIGSADNCPDDYNPMQEDYDLDLQGDICDDDDDADTIVDGADSCSMGVKGWISDSVTDHDSDGCKDVDDEDPDDDNDGLSDQHDACPVGIVGSGSDHDGDGCKDAEDSDDDNDLIGDGSDYCSQGDIGWLAGEVTDYDSDGCKDDTEDDDDDNDGVLDVLDQCQRGEIGWDSNINTDFDGDGCRDGVEDVDDDDDGVNNPSDYCPYSTGEVDDTGCSEQQHLNPNGNQSMPSIFYVCEGGSAVVLDMDDCPEGGEPDDPDNNSTQSPSFYYVCEGGQMIVLDYADCPEYAGSGNQSVNQSEFNLNNVTLVISSNSTLPEGFSICPGGTAIVIDDTDCPGNQDSQGTEGVGDDLSSGDGGSTDDLLLMMVGAALILSVIAVLVVLLRRPVTQPIQHLDFDVEPQVIDDFSMNDVSSSNPPSSIGGTLHNGSEWIEWPTGSGQQWHRVPGSNAGWLRWHG
jgi:hypothetical protein